MDREINSYAILKNVDTWRGEYRGVRLDEPWVWQGR